MLDKKIAVGALQAHQVLARIQIMCILQHLAMKRQTKDLGSLELDNNFQQC